MNKWNSKIWAWIYPGTPADDALTELADGRVVYGVKIQWFKTEDNGDTTQIDVGDLVNGYSPTNAGICIANTTKQFITVSANHTQVTALCSDAGQRAAAISAYITLLDTAGFTGGMELDFEGYGQWTAEDYENYKIFVDELGTALHAEGYELMIDGPMITNYNGKPIADSADKQELYKWNYADFNALPVDIICMLSYDKEYDYGAGTSVSPTSLVQASCDWILSQITDPSKLMIGMPSFGYHGTTAGFVITIDTKAQSSVRTGFGGAVRNADFEMAFDDSGVSSIYQDTSGLNSKREIIEAKGIPNISVWHLGGNDWFTGEEPSDVTRANGIGLPVRTFNEGFEVGQIKKLNVVNADITLVAPSTGSIVQLPSTGELITKASIADDLNTPFTYSTDYAATGRFVKTAVNGGTAVFDAYGVNLSTGASASASERVLWVLGLDNADSGVFKNSPKIGIQTSINCATTTVGQWYGGLGVVAVNGAGHTFTVDHIGFKIVGNGSTMTVSGTTGITDDTAETTATLTTVVQNDNIILKAVVMNNTTVQFWYNKNLSGWLLGGTITSGIPIVGQAAYLQQSVSNVATANDFIVISSGASVTY